MVSITITSESADALNELNRLLGRSGNNERLSAFIRKHDLLTGWESSKIGWSVAYLRAVHRLPAAELCHELDWVKK